MRSIEERAKALHSELITHRRHLHQNPETGVNTENTKRYVEKVLREYGYKPERLGKAGVAATAGDAGSGRCILLRADMDALPIQEETGLPFASRNGNMHACGHDCHTAMLLIAAKLLKEDEEKLAGCVKFLFQSGEETMEGALDAVASGVLSDPDVQVSVAMHVVPGTDFPSGALLVYGGGPSYASIDWFRVDIQGKGSHGAMPELSVNPLAIMAEIYQAIHTMLALEIPAAEQVVVTVGEMHGGSAANVIPDTAFMTGTIRTFDESVRRRIKEKLAQKSSALAALKGGGATVTYHSSAPYVRCDPQFSGKVIEYLQAEMGSETVLNLGTYRDGACARTMTSEDFAFIAEKTAASVIWFAAGNKEDGYPYSLHHPKADFKEDILYRGAAAYACVARAWLQVRQSIESV